MLWASTVVRDKWDKSTAGTLMRLLNEDKAISYTAAYLDLLRDHQPPDTSWATIYGTPQPGIGEYNVSSKFVAGFTKAATYFSYLDPG